MGFECRLRRVCRRFGSTLYRCCDTCRYACDSIRKVGNDLEAAVAALPRDLGPGDVILVKGVVPKALGRIALMLSGAGFAAGSSPARCSNGCPDHCGMLGGWVRPGFLSRVRSRSSPRRMSPETPTDYGFAGGRIRTRRDEAAPDCRYTR